MDRYNIHIIDDDQTLLRSWVMLFESLGYDVHEYQSANDFLTNYNRRQIECIIIDIWLPGCNGDKLFEEIRHRGITAPCIFWSGQMSIELAVNLMKKGAVNVIEKGVEHLKIKAAIDDALKICQKSRVKQSLLETFKKNLKRLSKTELEVFESILERKSVDETAMLKNRSPRTISEQRRNIFRKLELKTANEVYNHCREIGYIVYPSW
ncbi:MAG: response regulator transcription factor [Francisellaceae bacterium]